MSNIDRGNADWQQYLNDYYKLASSRGKLFGYGDACIGTLKKALTIPSERPAALDLLLHLPSQYAQELLPDLVHLATFQHGELALVQVQIAALPRKWLLDRIELLADQELGHAIDDEPFRRLLELFSLLDKELTTRLALRAKSHPDPHVQEAGEDYLS